MHILKSHTLESQNIRASEITPREVYMRRREFLAGLAAAALTGPVGSKAAHAGVLPAAKSPYSTDEKLTRLDDITSYNNFEEFGSGKSTPAARAQKLTTRPWTITVDGLVAKPITLGIDDILKTIPLEERIYRFRCVEGWSMVVPWIGFPLSEILKKAEPLGSAKFVAFESVVRPSEMPGQQGLFQQLPWPYREGLRLDEALHPLTLLAVGLYGDILPKQNGAPIRLVVPWKYGFKSAKSIVRISLVERQPVTTWNQLDAGEYGFYSNVNPQVDHPRWSQATERRLGEGGLFQRRRTTLPFNGYGAEVAQLYAGLDLKVNF